jgi:predicted CoA-substrate-specific enzyme activase
MTVIDIGGQDNKVIRLGDDGRRLDFKMNRKCAAGTGAFVEEIALRLDLPLSEMESLAASTDRAVRLSSFCTVFAKTEILSHLRQGVPVAEIVRGAFQSVIQRVVEMDPLTGTVVLTGGVVAHNPTVAQLLGQQLGRDVIVPPDPQQTGALGAALIARKQQEDSHGGNEA